MAEGDGCKLAMVSASNVNCCLRNSFMESALVQAALYHDISVGCSL